MCSVEGLGLQHYAQPSRGGWRGVHDEGATLRTLFALLMWDVLFADVPGAFVGPCQTAPLDLDDGRSAALCTLLFAELDEQSTVPLHLPLPTDGRARVLAEAITDAPSAPLADLLRDVPAARRTCERLFLGETGLTLAGWQRRARVLAAIELLERGSTVTTASATVGYATPSSFVVAFRSETGTTPTAFLTPD